jgi:hypothetical protein
MIPHLARAIPVESQTKRAAHQSPVQRNPDERDASLYTGIVGIVYGMMYTVGMEVSVKRRYHVSKHRRIAATERIEGQPGLFFFAVFAFKSSTALDPS